MDNFPKRPNWDDHVYFNYEFKRIGLENLEEGILKKYFSKNSSYAKIKGSTSIQNTDDQKILDLSYYWRSESVNKSNYTISLNSNYIQLSSFAMFSCISDQCAYNLDVLGSNNGKDWALIGEVRKDTNYFMNKIAFEDCKAKKVYKSIRFMKIGESHNGGYSFTLWYLDIFGKLYKNIPSIDTNYHKNTPINMYLFLLILFVC